MRFAAGPNELRPSLPVRINSAKHLPAYLDEISKYNNRENPYLFRDTLMRLLASEAVEYKHLIAP